MLMESGRVGSWPNTPMYRKSKKSAVLLQGQWLRSLSTLFDGDAVSSRLLRWYVLSESSRRHGVGGC